MEGLTYQSVGAGAHREDWQALLDWVEQGRYDTRNYGLLETFFKQGGYQGHEPTKSISKASAGRS